MANEYIYSFSHLPFYYPIQYANKYVMNHNKTMLLPSSSNFPCLLIVFLLRKKIIFCTNFKTALQYDLYFYYSWSRKILKYITRNGSAELLYSVRICKSSTDTITKTFSKKTSAKILVFFFFSSAIRKKEGNTLRSFPLCIFPSRPNSQKNKNVRLSH